MGYAHAQYDIKTNFNDDYETSFGSVLTLLTVENASIKDIKSMLERYNFKIREHISVTAKNVMKNDQGRIKIFVDACSARVSIEPSGERMMIYVNTGSADIEEAMKMLERMNYPQIERICVKTMSKDPGFCQQDSDCVVSRTCSMCGKCVSRYYTLQIDCMAICCPRGSAGCKCENNVCAPIKAEEKER
jgi:hypothetical protein